MYKSKNTSFLDRIANKTAVEQSSNKDTALLLSAPERREEIDILKKIGLSAHIEEVEATLNDANRVKITSEKYNNRKVYYGHQIKKLCSEYDLKMLRADSFKGKIPKEIGQSILDFIKENTSIHEKSETRTVEKTDLDIVESSFFIVTTRDSFKGYKMESATLFYREGGGNYRGAEEKEVFVEIFSWGKPYSNNYGQAFLDIFRDGKDSNWNIVTFIVSAVVFLCTLFSEFSVPFYWIAAYLLSVIILLLSTTNKSSKWNQVEN